MTNEERARYVKGDESAHWPVDEERPARLAPFTGQLLLLQPLMASIVLASP